MSFRSLYRKRRMISAWSMATIALIALYHKFNLNFHVLNVAMPLPPDAKESLHISMKDYDDDDESVHRLFEKTSAPIVSDDDDDNEDFNEKKLQWKLNRIHFYLNNTVDTSIFPAFQIGRYVILNSNLCRDADVVDILIIVHTAPLNFEKRLRIRQTFAKRSLYLPYEVRLAFLMGRPRNDMEEHVLFSEQARYNDTVMGDFHDDYHNLTIKGAMGYRWISQHCSNARFILKIDDDVIVDMYKVLTRYIPHMENKPKSIFCNVWRKNMKIERGGKWKVPMNMFSNTTVFPFYYCSGFTLLMSRDLIEPMYQAAKITPLFWIDDLYLFGMLPFVVGGVTFHDYQIGRNISISQEETYNCWDKLGAQCSILSTLVRQDDYMKFWKKIQQLNDQSSWGALTFFEP